jgi:hypothetical protein
MRRDFGVSDFVALRDLDVKVFGELIEFTTIRKSGYR